MFQWGLYDYKCIHAKGTNCLRLAKGYTLRDVKRKDNIRKGGDLLKLRICNKYIKKLKNFKFFEDRQLTTIWINGVKKDLQEII